ncbi:MAG: ATP-binding protein [Gammaproteobacteria bacterium]
MSTGPAPSYSLQSRLLVAVSILLTLFLGLAGIVLDRAFRSSIEAGVAEQLQAQIYVLLSAVEEEGGQFYFLQDLREPRFSQLNSGLYGLVSNPDIGEVLRTPSALELNFVDFSRLWQSVGRGEFRFTRAMAGDGVEYFVAAYGVIWENGSAPYDFAVVESTSTYMVEVNNFRKSLWSWFVGVAVLLLVVQVLLLHWGLSPLRRLAADLKRIESGEGEQLDPDYPKELQAVTQNLNLLIKSERKQQTRYRETLGDLAHSLKTPLAVVAGLLQSLSHKGAMHEDDEAQNQIQAVEEQLERMNQIVGYQLQRAVKSNGSSSLARRVDVAAALGKILGALEKVYAAKGMQVSSRIEAGLFFLGDERDLMEVLGNVLDNAFKYGSHRVGVEALIREQPQRQLRIRVEDDGPGISAGDQGFVLQRGARLDTLAQGQGIGLAVVSDIMSSYGGQIDIGSSEQGGARVELVFNNFHRDSEGKP